MTLNSNNLPQAHHVMEFAGEREARTVRICRCWKSQRFPYCDDSHKQLLEHGEAVGPFIARIEPHFPKTTTATISSTVPNSNHASALPGKVFTRSVAGLATVLVAAAGVMAYNQLHNSVFLTRRTTLDKTTSPSCVMCEELSQN